MRIAVLFFVLICASHLGAQSLTKDFAVGTRPRIEIENRFGQVRVATDDKLQNKVLLEATSPSGEIIDDEIVAQAASEKISLSVNETQKRVDLILRVPVRARLKITGASGAIEVAGNFESAKISSDTGTIYANVPTDALKFDLLWTESRPRYQSDFEIPAPKEKAGGKFTISGESPKSTIQDSKSEEMLGKMPLSDENLEPKNQKPKTESQKPKDQRISLDFSTKRGVILLNVPPSEVPVDLRERPLTSAAKAIVKSGDSILSEAIRRAAPKYFNDYLKTLLNRRLTPRIVSRETSAASSAQTDILRQINLSVSDKNGRAMDNLKAEDFALFENSELKEIIKVEPTTTPFNLVLLLDVSGSVEQRIDFIRKAARNFVNTVSARDKLAIVTFRDDAEVVSNFTVDKISLSQSLDTFEAGGGTALYDSLAYVLADTLRPLKNERTAIVILSDGDDNRSFVPFEPLLGAIQESGALVYPLYIPSGLIPNNNQPTASETLDPLRSKYLTLTSKAETEAKKLAEVSGGVYFPIRRLEDLQKAYDDVVAQLRTAYSLTYRSKTVSPRIRVSVKREGAFVRTGTIAKIE